MLSWIALPVISGIAEDGFRVGFTTNKACGAATVTVFTRYRPVGSYTQGRTCAGPSYSFSPGLQSRLGTFDLQPGTTYG